ncbi:MAG: hypothetical protein R3B13_37395 [Polyangiaceae bacterium]
MREHLVELLDVAPLATLLHDRFRSIEHRHEWQSAEGDEVTREATQNGFHTLIIDERDLREPRVLQS